MKIDFFNKKMIFSQKNHNKYTLYAKTFRLLSWLSSSFEKDEMVTVHGKNRHSLDTTHMFEIESIKKFSKRKY